MNHKFNVGDIVDVKNAGVGRIKDILRYQNHLSWVMSYKYEVIFSDGVEKICAEDELELYVEKACETPNNVVHNSTTRPCYYLEEKAMFHRWVDETKLIMKFSEHLKVAAMWELKKIYEDIGLLAGGMDAIPVTTTFALIEVADGSMKKVLPEEIRFINECQ